MSNFYDILDIGYFHHQSAFLISRKFILANIDCL